MNAGPAIGLLATGGTIVSTRDGTRSDWPEFSLPLTALIDASQKEDQPPFAHTEELLRIDSCDMTPALMIDVAARIDALLRDPRLDGIVVTHGSDTAEETAFVCDLLLDTGKPVVFTAALRSDGELGADGPRNVAAARKVAADPRLRDVGVTLVVNDEIHAARWVRKLNSIRPPAFGSPTHGPLGVVSPGGTRLRFAPTERVSIPAPSRPVAELPRVPLVQVYTGMAPADLRRHVEDDAVGGLVLDGFGMGNVPADLADCVGEIVEQGVTVAVTSRTPAGGAHAVYGGGGAAALQERGASLGGPLSAPKARLLLMLLLAHDVPTTRVSFEDAISRFEGEGRADRSPSSMARSSLAYAQLQGDVSTHQEERVP